MIFKILEEIYIVKIRRIICKIAVGKYTCKSADHTTTNRFKNEIVIEFFWRIQFQSLYPSKPKYYIKGLPNSFYTFNLLLSKALISYFLTMACSRTEESYEAPLRQPSRSHRRLNHEALEWELGSDYEYSKVIGKNDYGDRYGFIQRFTGSKVGMQCFDDVCEDIVKGKEMLRDLILLKSLQHPCILNVVDVINLPTTPIYIIYEHAQASLRKVFKSPIHLEMIHAKALMYNMLVAMKYVHSAGLVHGNLKPSYVYINEDCSLKLSRFGQAKCLKQHNNAHIEEEKSDRNSPQKESDVEDGADLITNKPKLIKPKEIVRGSQAHPVAFYGAPETLFPDQNQTSAADIWSIGCILSEVLGMIRENAPTFLGRSPLFFDRYISLLDHDKK